MIGVKTINTWVRVLLLIQHLVRVRTLEKATIEQTPDKTPITSPETPKVVSSNDESSASSAVSTSIVVPVPALQEVNDAQGSSPTQVQRFSYLGKKKSHNRKIHTFLDQCGVGWPRRRHHRRHDTHILGEERVALRHRKNFLSHRRSTKHQPEAPR